MARKILRKFYLLIFVMYFFTSLMFTTYVPFLESNGINKYQMGQINAFYMMIVFLLEIPTGTLADVLGRKKSFLLSILMTSISFTIYYFSRNFWFFILAETFAAFAWAFSSGALEAWIVDSLNYHDFKGKLNDVFAKENAIRQTSVIFGGFIGAHIGQTDLSLPWLICSLGGIISFLLAIKIKEEYFIPQKLNGFKESKNHFFKIIKDSINYGLKNKNVFYLICINSGIFLGIQSFNMYWTLKFKEHITQSNLGWVWTLFSLMTILGSFSNKILGKIKVKKKIIIFFYVLIISWGGLTCVTFYNRFIILIFFFAIHEFGRGGYSPITKAYINERIPSSKRATILSFDSMVKHLGACLGLLIAGYFSKNYSIQIAWLIGSIFIFLASFICFKLNGKED